MATMRELRRRINSVHSSQKITGAMKMISSARMRKVEVSLEHARPYEEQLQRIMNHIDGQDCEYVSPLTEKRELRRVTLVALASDEGLCGAFNINVLKHLTERVKDYRQRISTPVEIYPVGRKILGGVHRLSGIEQHEIPQAFEKKEYAEAVKILTAELIARFIGGETDRVELIYTHYKSRGSQQLTHLQLLPFLPMNKRQVPEQAGPDRPEEKLYYLYEPDCRSIFEILYPLVVRTMFYKALLESQTSEQAMRILAMQSANDNAVKLLGKLQLEYNKLRQQSITSELLDISGASFSEG